MRAHTLEHAATRESARVRMRTLLFASFIVVLLFSLVYVRHLCIKTGYEISNLSEKVEKTEVTYLYLLDKRSKEYDTENLYKKAKSIGLVLPDVKRTFYVK